MHIYLCSGENTIEVQEAKEEEVKGVRAAEGGDIITALDHFNRAVALQPNRASCYNNRAQALRLKGDVAGWLFF